MTVRFLGIDTPESTAQVEPWGKAASAFTKSKLESAQSIVLESEIGVYGQMDSTGGRYLGWVWYQPAGTSVYRLLNLEIVEMAYSKDFTSPKSKYYDKFKAASVNAKATGLRVYGENDPDYDYTPDGVVVSAYELVHNYATYENIALFKITGLVVAKAAYSVFIRDVTPTVLEDGSEVYGGIYVYGGYKTGLIGFAKVGRIVEFYARAQRYHGAVELSDIQTSATGDYPYKVISSDNNFESVVIDNTKDLSYYMGQYITANIEVTSISTSESSAVDFTVHGKIAGTEKLMDIYANGNLYPVYQASKIEVGSTYAVTGLLDPTEDAAVYEIKLGDNTGSTYANFKKITKE